jgi:hypothetical protein
MRSGQHTTILPHFCRSCLSVNLRNLWQKVPYFLLRGQSECVRHDQEREVTARRQSRSGGPWIERITLTGFPQAVQIVDWGHASGCLWAVGHTLRSEGREEARQWVEAGLDDLWDGKGQAVKWVQQRCPPPYASPWTRLETEQCSKHPEKFSALRRVGNLTILMIRYDTER